MNEQNDITAGTEPITDLDELCAKAGDLVDNPISVWAVAATIESLGLRDVDAQKDFNYESVFELAKKVYKEIKEKVDSKNEIVSTHSLTEAQFNIPSIGSQLWDFARFYSVGILFSLPMLSQIAAVIIFRYSLWAWLEFNEAQATVVAFGTIVAFVITGGFTQVLGRAVSKYKGEGNFLLAFKAAKKIVKGGAVTIIATMAFFYVLNLIIPFYPQEMLLLGIAYLGFISFLLLASSVLYAIEQRLVILAIIIGGTSIVIVGMDVLEAGIYASQWVGMTCTILMLAGYAYLYFKFNIWLTKSDKNEKSLPGADLRFYINYRYFVYGFGYFLFLFIDRMLAWTAGPPPPYIMWFNTPYELGMDWALLSLVLTIAILEYSVNAFSKLLMPLQKESVLLHLEKFLAYFQKFHLRQMGFILVLGTASILLTYYSINSLRMFSEEIPEIRDFFGNPMTTQVFWAASISYMFMVIGLLHTLFFLTLHRPAFAMYSIIGAILVNFSVGYVCSRIFSLEYAVIGLLAGSVAFALISGVIANAFFKRLDYYYYSAF